jgi:hypothetical protein
MTFHACFYPNGLRAPPGSSFAGKASRSLLRPQVICPKLLLIPAMAVLRTVSAPVSSEARAEKWILSGQCGIIGGLRCGPTRTGSIISAGA